METIKFLLEEVKVNVNRKDVFGKTAIQSAGQLHSEEILQLLQQYSLLNNVQVNKLNLLNDANMNNMINCKMNCGGNWQSYALHCQVSPHLNKNVFNPLQYPCDGCWACYQYTYKRCILVNDWRMTWSYGLQSFSQMVYYYIVRQYQVCVSIEIFDYFWTFIFLV